MILLYEFLLPDFFTVFRGTDLKFGFKNPVKMTLIIKPNIKGDFANVQVPVLQQSF